jgi:hypothetical protein
LAHTALAKKIDKHELLILTGGFVLALALHLFVSEEPSGVGVVGSALLAVGLSVVSLIVGRVICGARHGRPIPWLLVRAFLGLGFTVVLFAGVYYGIGGSKDWKCEMPRGKVCHLSQGEALYVSVGTLSTAGTGGTSAKSEEAQLLLTLQMVVDLVVVAGMLAVVVTRLAEPPRGVPGLTGRRWKRRSPPRSGSPHKRPRQR